MYPYLSLAEVELDIQLGRSLPRHLAYYHLALPVAEDENGVTVALAQPDNRTARQVIESALGHVIVPVQSQDDDIRSALDRIWEGVDSSHGGVWAWTDDASLRPALSAHIERAISAAFPRLSVQTCDSHDPSAMVSDARSANAALVVAHSADPAVRSMLLRHAPTAIWLTRDLTSVPARIVCVLRGNIPDRQLLDWLPPLAAVRPAQTIALAAAEPAATASGSPLFSRFAALLSPDDPRGAHLADLRRAFTDLGVTGRLRVHEGTLGEVILAETAASSYDLLVMAAEASGEFAADIFNRMWDRLGGALLIKAG
jgi:hypothetical protein